MQTRIISMLELQDKMNRKVHPDWRNQGFDWYRAIWVECAELMDHYGWKWWKKQMPDMEQVKLEVIDIWHFGLSQLMQASGDNNETLAKTIAVCFEEGKNLTAFRDALEDFTQWTLVNRDFSTEEFVKLMLATGLTFDELYMGYTGKNVLNFFRQDHGYKEGTYIKEWNGKEDNEHLVELTALLDPANVSFQDDLYQGLQRRYDALQK